MSIPDYALETTFDFKFTTRAFATGVPTTLSGTPAVEIYEDNSVTQITTAETLTVDFDSVTGLNNLRIAATAANGFESGKSYAAVISAGTVGGVSVVGEVLLNFSIERTSALRPSTAGRTLGVEADGDLTKVNTLDGHTAQTGDSFARLGAPAGASVSADIAAVPTATENADALLNRDMSAVSDTNSRSPLNALRFLRNKWSISGTTLTVTEEDDSTSAWTSTVTTDAAADPVTGNDPA